jgi:hypothetical protein
MEIAMNRKKAVYGFAMFLFASASLGSFILAASEQSLLSIGSPAAARIGLQELIAQGPGKNKHVELTGFYFGKHYVYTAQAVQFKDVYVPVFPTDKPEEAGNLQILVWIRNDRNSNERFIESQSDLEEYVSKFNQAPRFVSGVLQKPTKQVRALTAEAYPGMNGEALQILWARDFPSQSSINVLWSLLIGCLAATVVCGVAYRRQSRTRSASIRRETLRA